MLDCVEIEEGKTTNRAVVGLAKTPVPVVSTSTPQHCNLTFSIQFSSGQLYHRVYQESKRSCLLPSRSHPQMSSTRF